MERELQGQRSDFSAQGQISAAAEEAMNPSKKSGLSRAESGNTRLFFPRNVEPTEWCLAECDANGFTVLSMRTTISG